MFVRLKPAGGHRYLQIVESFREGPRIRQRVIATLGRLDRLQASGQVDDLARGLARHALHVRLREEQRNGHLQARRILRLGPPLVVERLWRKLGLPEVIAQLSQGRRFEFSLERAIFLTVLHRLFAQGSDRAAEKWKDSYRIAGAEDLELQHLYRAMGWLGENKDAVEDGLFAATRDLFAELSLVFFDTTSLYFEGQGGESFGQHGHSKDHRPDLHQMVVGAALDKKGRPVACELWPGNQADAKALLPAVDRLQKRFKIERACVVADRGMISAGTIAALEERKWSYILGARMRRVKEVREAVLPRLGCYHKVAENLQVQELSVEGRRYVVCLNPEEAKKDKADREAIVASLKETLRGGAKKLVGNRGYRRYLRLKGSAAEIDWDKVKEEEQFDGLFVLRTNLPDEAGVVAQRYKELWRVEQAFRTVKSVLETRPIYHKCDDTIKGHVFASFLALVVLHEINLRLEEREEQLEWEDVKRDLEALAEVEVLEGERRYWLRTEFRGAAWPVFQAVGLAAPPTAREG